jgi:homoserine O-acetyltransferase/O-succinyltransferase
VDVEEQDRRMPVTGAWDPLRDPIGRRRFFRFAQDHPLALEGGGRLRDLTLAYETWGTLDADGGNAVLICHAWTGDSHVVGPAGKGHPTSGWWEGIVGPGAAIDTDRYFVVCANVLGGCQGSTGPASVDPATGARYGSRFPQVSIRDMVRTQALLADHLGIRQWLSVVGGSMGGMQVLEWGVTFPTRVRSLVAVATCAASSAKQIALGAVGRRAIRMDPRWRNGDYYDAEPGDGPHDGLAVARMLAQITFRSDDVFQDRFGRELADGARAQEGFHLWQRFEVERYLDYHGEKLVRRFDANSYLVLSKAMDLHDIGRGRGGMERAYGRIGVPVLSMGIPTDQLYPEYQQWEIRDGLLAARGRVEYVRIDSPHGHDAFLIDLDQVGGAIRPFLDDVAKSAT